MASCKILICDSDPAATLVTQHGLRRLRPGAEVTSEPFAAQAWLRCMHEPIDLLIIDPTPASSTTMGLIKALRADHPATEVLVLTAYDTPRLRTQMRELGVKHYLAKPLDLHELGREVERLLDRRPRAASVS